MARLIPFDIDAAIEEVLDERLPGYWRALRLFEFLAAVHLCAEPEEGGQGGQGAADRGFVIAVPRKAMRSARLLAPIRFMEAIEAEIRASSGPGHGGMLRRCADNEDFAHLYERVFLEGGGWKADRYRRGARGLSAALEDAEVDAWRLAKILGLSAGYRYNPEKPRTLGGIGMALWLAVRFEPLELNVKHSALKNCWRRLRPVAGWVYLTQVAPLLPRPVPLPKKRDFTASLLGAVGDRERLVEFFARYGQVRAHLKARNYALQPIAARIKLPKAPGSPLDFAPLPPEAVLLLEKYKGE